MDWIGYKIYGPWEIENEGLAWCIFAQRSDGAVVWQNLSVWPHQDFWNRAAQAFEHMDNMLEHKLPDTCYIDFATARVSWERVFL